MKEKSKEKLIDQCNQLEKLLVKATDMAARAHEHEIFKEIANDAVEDEICDKICKAFNIPREYMNVDFGSIMSQRNAGNTILEAALSAKSLYLAQKAKTWMILNGYITLAIDLCNSAGAVFTPAQIVELRVVALDKFEITNAILRSKYLKKAHMVKNEDGINNFIYNLSITIHDNHEINISKKDKMASEAKYNDPFVKYYLNHLAEKLDKVFDFDSAADELTKRMDDEWCKDLY